MTFSGNPEKEQKNENLSALYRTEQNLRYALTPVSAQLFKKLNFQPGGLKLLVDLRADLRELIEYVMALPLCFP